MAGRTIRTRLSRRSITGAGTYWFLLAGRLLCKPNKKPSLSEEEQHSRGFWDWVQPVMGPIPGSRGETGVSPVWRAGRPLLHRLGYDE